MRLGYADPPYPGLAHLYKDHPDFAGEVDHGALIAQLEAEFDGWVLHTSAPAIPIMAPRRRSIRRDLRPISRKWRGKSRVGIVETAIAVVQRLI